MVMRTAETKGRVLLGRDGGRFTRFFGLRGEAADKITARRNKRQTRTRLSKSVSQFELANSFFLFCEVVSQCNPTT